jgi:SAM-dependent methyltransferase
MNSPAKASWSAFNAETAKIYLDGFGHPSERSKILMASVLAERFGGRPFRLADFGCGNGHLYGFFRQRGLNLHYTGYDFSTSLLQAAREKYPGDEQVRIREADIQDPMMEGEQADIALFSHVLEMLECPGGALAAARRLAPSIMIRFFEPPVPRHDVAALHYMNIGPDTEKVPALRRSLDADFYDLLLAKAGCRSVDIHKLEGDKDQIHVLNF